MRHTKMTPCRTGLLISQSSDYSKEPTGEKVRQVVSARSEDREIRLPTFMRRKEPLKT